MFKLRKNKKGFTLVELMVVVVIIGILTAIAIPVYSAVQSDARNKACLATQRTIDSAVMMYRAAHDGSDPASIGDLIPTYIATTPQCPDGGEYTMIDKTAHVCICSIHDDRAVETNAEKPEA